MDKHRDNGREATRSAEEAERLIREALPGKEHVRTVAGNPRLVSTGAFVAAVSFLEGAWYTSLLDLYDPFADVSSESAARGTTKARGDRGPRDFPGVPPAPEGVSIRFQRSYDDPVEAGATYGFIRSALLEEGREPEERLSGVARLERWMHRCEQTEAFERLYAHPDLARDPAYREELERTIRELVPDPAEREALHSFHEFKAANPGNA